MVDVETRSLVRKKLYRDSLLLDQALSNGTVEEKNKTRIKRAAVRTEKVIFDEFFENAEGYKRASKTAIRRLIKQTTASKNRPLHSTATLASSAKTRPTEDDDQKITQETEPIKTEPLPPLRQDQSLIGKNCIKDQ